MTGLIEEITTSEQFDITGNINMKGFKFFNLGLGVDLQDSTNKVQLNAVITDVDKLDVSVNALDASLSVLNNLDASLTIIENDINKLDVSFNALDATISGIDASLNLLDLSNISFGIDISRIDNSINLIDTSLARLNILDNSFLLIENDIIKLETSANFYESSLNQFNTEITSLETSANSYENSINKLDISVNLNTNTIAALDASIVDLSNTYLPLAGGTMTGDINLNNKKLTGIDELSGSGTNNIKVNNTINLDGNALNNVNILDSVGSDPISMTADFDMCDNTITNIDEIQGTGSNAIRSLSDLNMRGNQLTNLVTIDSSGGTILYEGAEFKFNATTAGTGNARKLHMGLATYGGGKIQSCTVLGGISDPQMDNVNTVRFENYVMSTKQPFPFITINVTGGNTIPGSFPSEPTAFGVNLDKVVNTALGKYTCYYDVSLSSANYTAVCSINQSNNNRICNIFEKTTSYLRVKTSLVSSSADPVLFNTNFNVIVMNDFFTHTFPP